MAASKIVSQDRTVYESPDGRVKVVWHATRDFSLFLDGQYTKSYQASYQAEHDGAVWLEEQAAQLGADLADETAAPPIRTERMQSASDELPEDAWSGTRYLCGNERDGGAEVFIFDTPGDEPQFYAFGRDGIPLAEVRRTLPAILALLSDPRVLAAEQQHQAIERHPAKAAA